VRFGGRFVTNALMIGSFVGAIIGLFHARYVYVQQVSEFPQKLIEQPVAVRARAGYFALWTFLLWVLFGSYVFYLWVISIAVYAVWNALKKLSNLVLTT